MRNFLADEGFILGVLIVNFFPSAIRRRCLWVILALGGILADPELLMEVGLGAFVDVGF